MRRGAFSLLAGRIKRTGYNADWALREGYVHPRPHAGSLSREDVIALCGTLDVDGLELMHQYWEGSSPAYVRGLAEDAGLPIVSYIFFFDLGLTQDERSAAIDEDPLETLHTMAPHVAHLHVKNSRPLAPGEQRARYLDGDGGQRYTGTDLDGGVIDLPPLLAELGHLGYDGFVLLEYQGEEDPRVSLPRNIAHLRRLLEPL